MFASVGYPWEAGEQGEQDDSDAQKALREAEEEREGRSGVHTAETFSPRSKTATVENCKGYFGETGYSEVMMQNSTAVWFEE
jgi:hypothetical protein